MRESDLVRTVTVRHKSEGAAQVIADNKALAASQEQLGAASVKLATVTEDSARRQASQLSKFQSNERGVNPAAKALKDYNDTLRVSQNAVNQNSALEERANAVLGVKADRLLAALAAQRKLNEETQRANQLQMPNSAVNINSRTGVSPPITGAAAASASVFEEQFALQAAAAGKLRDSLNPLAGEQANLNAKMTEYKALLQSLDITQSEFSALQAKAVSVYDNQTAAIQRQIVAQENLRRQQANTATMPTGTVSAPQLIGVTHANLGPEYAAQYEAAAKAQDDMVAAAGRVRAALNPLAAAQQQYDSELRVYKGALEATLISQQEFAAAQVITTEKFNQQAAAIQQAVVAQENLRREQANSSTVSSPLSTARNATGNIPGVPSNYAAQFEAAAKAEDDMVASTARLRAQLNPVAVEQARVNAELAIHKQALDANKISEGEFAGAQALAAKRVADFAQNLKTASTTGRVMSGELVNMSYQLNDVVTGLALGQSPFMIIAQQGGQVVQILQTSKASIGEFAKTAATALLGVVTPTTFVVAGITAIGAAAIYAASQLDKLQVSSQRAVSGAGARTGTTTTDINAFVDKNAPSKFSGATLSQNESRALAEGLTKTGDIVISKLNSMSAAVVGFSNQTGQSMDDAVKAFARMGSDPVKALDELAAAFGPFSQSTRTLVQDMVASGDKTLAWNAILNELGPTAKGTAGNLTVAEMATRGLVNALQTANQPSGLEKQLEGVRQKLNGAIEAAAQFAQHGVEVPSEASNSIVALNKAFEDLYAREQAVLGLKTAAVFDDLANKARGATEAIFSQIAQIEQLTQKIAELNRAKEAGATSKYGAEVDAGALQGAKNQLQALKESETQAIAYNNSVAAIAQSWGGVTQSTALQLNALQLQLPVVQAITEADKMRAQQQVTINTLTAQATPLYDAQQFAIKQFETSQAAATASVRRQTESLKDQNAMILAQGRGTEATTAAAIAYKNAIAAGADETTAAAAAAETLRGYTIKAAAAALEWQQNLLGVSAAAQQAAQALVNADQASANAAYNAANEAASIEHAKTTSDPSLTQHTGVSVSTFPRWLMNHLTKDTPGQSLSDSVDQNISGGGVDSALELAKTARPQTTYNKTFDIYGQHWDAGHTGGANISESDIISSVSSLYNLKNAQTTDQSVKDANIKQELAWLQSRPETIARDQEINQLTQSINNLAGSTDSLNQTNQDLLSPYYTQDPRTSHIGFRSQGMASGGEVTVPGGYSANDNMVAQIPVASGEIIAVRRPGQNASGSNQTINISVPLTIVGSSANPNQIGRTAYQAVQMAARKLRGAAI